MTKKPLARRLRQAVRDLAQPERPLANPAEFSRLYREKHLLVFRHIYGLCGGPTPLAEDLTAETFMRAWQARTSFSGSWEAATGWLLRIGRNLVIDHQRNRMEQNTTLFTESSDFAAEAALPEDALIQAEQQMILVALLQELPIQKREMVTLRYLLGWRIKQIADYLEMPENTVSVTIQRTLQQMRNRWHMVGVTGTVPKEQENVQV
jgi:RNA polymerase sigma-70 factor (ECF subfamily)